MGEDIRIDPWSSSQSTDYQRIIDQFGLTNLDYNNLPSPSMLHRRKIVFAHRDLDMILRAKSKNKSFGVLTGLMPSGRMHLGHKMVIDQVKWFQDLGADVTIAVADLEAHATRGLSLDSCRENALEEYISNYVAMGLDPQKTNIYFQSNRPIVQRIGFTLGKKTNLSEMEAIYGFNGETNLAHVQAPLVQVGDIVHPMLDEYGGLRPIVVPVGVDQDPHIRLTRGLTSKSNWFNLKSGKKGGMNISLSIQDENATKMGLSDDGRINREARDNLFSELTSNLSAIGFSDFIKNPKHGTFGIPSATISDYDEIKFILLNLERKMGGLGLLQPASTYHKFAVGMTGDKMSSSKPNTTIFLTDDLKAIEKKIKSAFSGGKSTVEEHRQYGGDPDIDVAYQYMMYFFEEDDEILRELNEGYRSGKILAGEMKQICIDKAIEWMKNHQELKDQNSHMVNEFLS
ncbi:MAG TPA: tryptophan--tRNA ligase [Candidatus Poseidoniaceae archaeon]|nr:tryptophan--tRNA ligase [Candidatus Poseidoniaceae archaeon]